MSASAKTHTPAARGATTGAPTVAIVRIVAPTAVPNVARIVKQAAATGTRVKCVGAGHSFTPIACTDGVLVDLTGSVPGIRRVQSLLHLPESERVSRPQSRVISTPTTPPLGDSWNG